MKRLLWSFVLAGIFGFLLVPNCPAPLVWRKGEGWSWESGSVVSANNPKEQIDLARQLQAKKDYGAAVGAYRRLIKRWPTAFAAQDARLGLAECLSAKGYHYKAFKEYQQLIDKHPNTDHYEAVLQRQFEIGNLFLAGERDKVWGVRLFPSREKAIEVYEQVVKNGPYSDVAPQAQLRIGLTYEGQRSYLDAVQAYEKLLENYPKHPMAEAAQFQIGYAYKQEAARAEYDQNAANQAINAFTDFMIRFPKSDRTPVAQQYLSDLRQEQSKGLFNIGRFYEKRKRYEAALIYYNEVVEQNPRSGWADAAREKIAHLTPQAKETTATP
jgi:outer membrane protein assembly factor BamD